jgi:phage regulator Rha-like protein
LQDYESFKNELSKILENQNINKKKKQDEILETTQKGFIGIALQNTEVLELNKKLTEQLEIVVEELSQIKQEREEKAARKEARANRKLVPIGSACPSAIQ